MDRRSSFRDEERASIARLYQVVHFEAAKTTGALSVRASPHALVGLVGSFSPSECIFSILQPSLKINVLCLEGVRNMKQCKRNEPLFNLHYSQSTHSLSEIHGADNKRIAAVFPIMRDEHHKNAKSDGQHLGEGCHYPQANKAQSQNQVHKSKNMLDCQDEDMPLIFSQMSHRSTKPSEGNHYKQLHRCVPSNSKFQEKVHRLKAMKKELRDLVEAEVVLRQAVQALEKEIDGERGGEAKA